MNKVSIVMPAYNAERFIEEAIQSVIKQTFSEWELIVVDDASCDKTTDIVRQLALLDVRITLVENKTNLGVSGTRNRGIGLATGEFIAFLDSDDIWVYDKLQRQLEILQQFHADLCYTAYTVMSESSKHLTTYRVPKTIDYVGMLGENVIGCSTVLLKRSSLGIYRFESTFFHEDYVLWLKLLKSGLTAVGIDEFFVKYRSGGRSRDKVSAAKNRWLIYRKCEKLSLPLAGYYFFKYCFNGFKKHIRAR